MNSVHLQQTKCWKLCIQLRGRGQNGLYGGGEMEKCIVCEQRKDSGIHLYTSFICIECEQEIVNTDIDDPKYKFYLKQLKVIKETRMTS